MPDTFVALGVALGLGLLVGFQRERTEESVAGFRTFPLITVVGALAARVGHAADTPWLLPAALLGLVALVVMGNLARWRREKPGKGITTEVASLVMFLVGATAAVGSIAAAVVMGGIVAVLLQFKRPMHELAERLSHDEVRAVMQIVVIGLVILPVLPDRAYGPYDVLNPFRIWMMVVLIVGISVASYVLYKLTDARVGTLLGGLLGGLISSTATTASYARRARGQRQVAPTAAVVLMVASTVVFARIFVEIGVVAPNVLREVAGPLGAMAAVNVLLSALAFWIWRGDQTEPAPADDPAQLRVALVFGALYGAIIFALAAAKARLGDVGLYVVSGISGLTDIDAITLSLANLADAGRLDTGTAWRATLLAALSNLAFKGGMAFFLGGPALAARIAPFFGASLAAGTGILLFWP
ncbi:MAG: MgtC/SapB family protein [Myxococcales bacterium]|nr:MgtC/SapB family protein [Myxococcales bacterium]